MEDLQIEDRVEIGNDEFLGHRLPGERAAVGGRAQLPLRQFRGPRGRLLQVTVERFGHEELAAGRFLAFIDGNEHFPSGAGRRGILCGWFRGSGGLAPRQRCQGHQHADVGVARRGGERRGRSVLGRRGRSLPGSRRGGVDAAKQMDEQGPQATEEHARGDGHIGRRCDQCDATRESGGRQDELRARVQLPGTEGGNCAEYDPAPGEHRGLVEDRQGDYRPFLDGKAEVRPSQRVGWPASGVRACRPGGASQGHLLPVLHGHQGKIAVCGVVGEQLCLHRLGMHVPGEVGLQGEELFTAFGDDGAAGQDHRILSDEEHEAGALEPAHDAHARRRVGVARSAERRRGLLQHAAIDEQP